jgi:hypothetical protein
MQLRYCLFIVYQGLCFKYKWMIQYMDKDY